jgi:anti-anti-sigma factor
MVDFSITAADDATVNITVAGELDIHTADDLQAVLDAALLSAGEVVLDFSAVSFADSTTLGVLVKAHHDAADRGRRLTIARPSRSIQRVLRFSGLLGLLSSEALGSTDDTDDPLADATPAG